MARGGWVRVRRGSPCQICQRPDWCCVTADGALAFCMRVESHRPKKIRGGEVGWLHKLDGDYTPPPQTHQDAPRRVVADVDNLAAKLRDRSQAVAVRTHLADLWDLRSSTLERLWVGVGWDDYGRQYSSWPSRGPDGHCVGIVRRYDSGKKLTYPGTSNSGVFVVERGWEAEGPVYLVEGGSDVAVLADRGVCAIGRPSCSGGAEVAAALMLRRGLDREVRVVAEMDRRDGVHAAGTRCNGCQRCWPGWAGAMRAVEWLDREGWLARVVVPSAKDVRAMAAAGDDLADWLTSV